MRRPRWLGRHHRQSPDRLEKEKTMRTIGRRSVTALALAATVLTLSAGCGSDSDTFDPAPTPLDTISAPTNVSWESYNGVRLPRSLADGPKNSSTTPSGYSQSPTRSCAGCDPGGTGVPRTDPGCELGGRDGLDRDRPRPPAAMNSPRIERWSRSPALFRLSKLRSSSRSRSPTTRPVIPLRRPST